LAAISSPIIPPAAKRPLAEWAGGTFVAGASGTRARSVEPHGSGLNRDLVLRL
jgi:hypothetical protein